jgi:CubicO group peptidase (beta-lactamase class C family)
MAICSGLWTGNQTQAQMDQYILAPARDLTTKVDESARTVSVAYSRDMPPRVAVWRPVLGCAQLPAGATADASRFLPRIDPAVRPPNYDDRPWPTGDMDSAGRLPSSQKRELDSIVDSAFGPGAYGGKTWGVIVLKDGRIVAERYDLGFGVHVGHQTHSAAKSFAATVVGIAVRKERLDIRRAPALQEWRRPGDPRREITIEYMLRMSSGLYAEGGGSPQADIYYQGSTVAEMAATNLLHTMPGRRFYYNPPDTMLAMRAVRQKLADDQRFLLYPFRELYWKIGMTRTVTTSDWNGDFLMSGQTYSTARDFARFGLLYLADGVWNGERILPEGWARYVATPGPQQPEGDSAGYGAQFWLYGGRAGLPADTFAANGGLGQFVMIIPSRNLVVVRRGLDEASAFRIEQFTADVEKAVSNITGAGR